MKLYDCEKKDIALGLYASGKLHTIISEMVFLETLYDLYFVQHKTQLEVASILSIRLPKLIQLLKDNFTDEERIAEKQWKTKQTVLKYRPIRKVEKKKSVPKSQKLKDCSEFGKNPKQLKFSEIEKLRELFFVNHMTYEQIGDLKSTSKQNAYKLIKRYFSKEEIELEYANRHANTERAITLNNSIQRKARIDEYKNTIVAMYNSGFPIKRIAELNNVSYDTIIDMLHSLRAKGIEIEKRNPAGGHFRK